MPLNKGKHIVSEVDGIRCTVVETGADEARVKFLKSLLEFNGFEVKTQEEPKKEDSADQRKLYIIGVTNILFNPVIAIYQRYLKTQDGKVVTPLYWNEGKDDAGLPYFLVKRRKA